MISIDLRLNFKNSCFVSHNKCMNFNPKYYRRFSAIFANSSLKHNFHHKGIISAKPPEYITNSAEIIEDHAIECGAEEVSPCEIQDGVFKVYCNIVVCST